MNSSYFSMTARSARMAWMSCGLKRSGHSGQQMLTRDSEISMRRYCRRQSAQDRCAHVMMSGNRSRACHSRHSGHSSCSEEEEPDADAVVANVDDDDVMAAAACPKVLSWLVAEGMLSSLTSAPDPDPPPDCRGRSLHRLGSRLLWLWLLWWWGWWWCRRRPKSEWRDSLRFLGVFLMEGRLTEEVAEWRSRSEPEQPRCCCWGCRCRWFIVLEGGAEKAKWETETSTPPAAGKGAFTLATPPLPGNVNELDKLKTRMDQEFEDMDSEDGQRWQNLYVDIRNQSHECPYKIAKYPENRNRNRYRDVSPFDHSRVRLGSTDNDYINASLVGPLKNTCSHFWMMIWEQRTKAVIMLNRVMEKGSEKCAQYWPTAVEQDMAFRDTGFLVTLVSEDVKSYYTTRVLALQNVHIYHFHYTTWPDFGVPDSPASFLNFLFKVRESSSLGAEHGPAVVHCSAGIGRSGTFSLVDTCLVLMDKRKDPSSVDIKSILLDMRKYRMGLIQTPDQLRFSYMAVLEGAKCIMGDASVQQQQQPQDHHRGAPRLNGGLRPEEEEVGGKEVKDGRLKTEKSPVLAPCKEVVVVDVDSGSTPARTSDT
ncbi:hypothetical protein CRUP_025207 [Coryphaenoides rupestris]|nr:hypothetical protein CRUP_025207 [Coryphaenoides rupestris]